MIKLLQRWEIKKEEAMKRTLKSLKAESLEHGVSVVCSDPIRCGIKFIDANLITLSWMNYMGEGQWTGFTSEPNVTGKKRGAKAEVMDWCLDWAINGF